MLQVSLFYKRGVGPGPHNRRMKPVITPVLQYAHVPVAVDWLVRALGFTTGPTSSAANGDVARANLRFGANALVVGAMAAATGRWKDVRLGLHVCLPGVAETEFVRDVGDYVWSRGPEDMGAGEGEATIVPERRYPSVSAAVDWLTTFGFRTTFQVPGPDGTAAHIEMRLGEGTIFLAPLSPERSGPFADVTQFVNLVVDDPDRHHAQAKAEGGNVVIAPRDTPFGARFYALRDPEHVLWWVSTYRPAATNG